MEGVKHGHSHCWVRWCSARWRVLVRRSHDFVVSTRRSSLEEDDGSHLQKLLQALSDTV